MSKPPLDPKLQRALDVCKAVEPHLTGEISFGPEFKAEGVTYHDLAKLCRLGYLIRTGEGRYVVYYRLAKD